jgi:hypothetical protein
MQTEERRPTPDEIPEQKLDYPASQRDMIPQPERTLVDCSTSKGAVHTFTKSLALNLGDRGFVSIP